VVTLRRHSSPAEQISADKVWNLKATGAFGKVQECSEWVILNGMIQYKSVPNVGF
jgi:hypothetical protein